MEDQQELVPEGWQAHDLRSGVAKVFAEAKRRSTLGIRVAAVWAFLLLGFGAMDFTGVTAVTHPLWGLGGGIAVLLLAALSMSRAPAPLLGAAAFVIADLVIISYGLADHVSHGSSRDHTALAVRIVLAPFTIFCVLNGYFGSLSIQAFKNGFSPGADWRTRISPRMMQALVFGSCAVALTLGVGGWLGAIMTGFAQTDVTWVTGSLMYDPVELTVATPELDVKSAGTDGKERDPFSELSVLKHREPPAVETFPESARPILSLEGLDSFATHAVEEAFEFAADTDQAGCMLEGQGRQDRCRDERCRYWARVFARACLTKSRKTEHFCDDVPEVSEEGLGMTWAQRMCAGRKFETCREILYATQGHCHPPKAAVEQGNVAKAGTARKNVSKPPAAK